MTRVFYASERGSTHGPGFLSELWRENLLGSWREVVKDVVEFEYDLDTMSRSLGAPGVSAHRIRTLKAEMGAELRRQFAVARAMGPVDVFFSYFTARHCDPESVREIRRSGARTVNWYCNASYQFDLIAPLAPAYDLCLVPEKFRLEDYKRIGATPLYCPEAANPRVYRPLDEPQVYDVVFVGQRYGERQAIIAHLRKRGIDVRVWGPGWAGPAQATGRRGVESMWRPLRRGWARLARPSDWRMLAGRVWDRLRYRLPPGVAGPGLSDEDLVRTYARAKIVLGLSAVGETHRSAQRIVQVRLRDIEAIMSGAFYITEFQEELAEMFEEDREVVFYRSTDELADKIHYYLRRPEVRDTIRQQGRARALAEHTWKRRFEMVLTVLGL